MSNKPLILAYYLPQFHQIPENDEWWGKGFTEWTNVRKAKPLYKGHDQPRVPAELGYYNLLDKDIREKQVLLAREAGIGGFCYWHYWFNGHQLMNNIIDEVAASGKPDFPFCLGWANESWSQKFWNKDSKTDKLLIEQTYGGLEDWRNHYEYVRTLFQNKNYIRIEGKPFFLIYKPENINEPKLYFDLWNQWIKEDGIADGIYFVAHLENTWQYEKWIKKGYSAVTPSPNPRVLYNHHCIHGFKRIWNDYKRRLFKLPIIIDMSDVNKTILDKTTDSREDVIPVLYPQWDHSPRSGRFVFVVENSTPQKFEEQVRNCLQLVSRKQNQIVMLKSWNEWAEGNYMEPDKTHGKGFIIALKNALGAVFNM